MQMGKSAEMGSSRKHARRVNGEGTIFRDAARGSWVGELFVDGKRYRRRGKTQTAVAVKLAELKRQGTDGTVAGDGNATVQQVLDLWRKRTLANRELAPGTVENYDWALRVLSGELGRVRLRSLDVARVESALDRIATGTTAGARGKPVSARTLKLMRSTLAQVLDLAVRRKLVASNPARIAELTPTAPRTTPRRALTADEAGVLWHALEGERLGNLFRLMLVTGLRPGEALGLCWDSVDLDAGLVNVRRAVRRERGRARLVDVLKTDGSYRTIGLPAPAVDVLRAQRRAVAELKLASRVWTVVDDELVFPTSQGTPWDLSNARDELTRICADAGVERVRPHELRHSAASILSDRGVPLELIADLLGHVDVTMLARVYRHRLRPSADAAVDVMGELFGSP